MDIKDWIMWYYMYIMVSIKRYQYINQELKRRYLKCIKVEFEDINRYQGLIKKLETKKRYKAFNRTYQMDIIVYTRKYEIDTSAWFRG